MKNPCLFFACFLLIISFTSTQAKDETFVETNYIHDAFCSSLEQKTWSLFSLDSTITLLAKAQIFLTTGIFFETHSKDLLNGNYPQTDTKPSSIILGRIIERVEDTRNILDYLEHITGSFNEDDISALLAKCNDGRIRLFIHTNNNWLNTFKDSAQKDCNINPVPHGVDNGNDPYLIKKSASFYGFGTLLISLPVLWGIGLCS